MSSNHWPRPPAPGTATQSGLVPRIGVRPCHGATAGQALLITIAIKPSRASFSPHHEPAPKWFEWFATTTATPRARAIRIAWSVQRSDTTCPRPFSPLYRRQTPSSRSTCPLAGTLIPPARSCWMYVVSIWIPCESTPRRLAAMRESATMRAWPSGAPSALSRSRPITCSDSAGKIRLRGVAGVVMAGKQRARRRRAQTDRRRGARPATQSADARSDRRACRPGPRRAT